MKKISAELVLNGVILLGTIAVGVAKGKVNEIKKTKKKAELVKEVLETIKKEG